MPEQNVPTGKEFERRWNALSESEQKELVRTASSGQTHDERAKAALVGGLAIVQLDRLGRWWVWLIAPVFAGIAVMIGDLLGASRNYVMALVLTVAGWVLLLWQRRQYSKSLNSSRERLGE